MFKAEAIGNIGADAQIKEGNGSKFVTFRVAHTDKWDANDGTKKEVTTWIDVVMNNTESKVLPYLKSGVKVYVRGNASLRVYSSPKDRMMKAGIQINAIDVELCGGTSDAVPRQIINPATGAISDVHKFYWVDPKELGVKKGTKIEVIDSRQNNYQVDEKGFVVPMQAQEPANAEQSQDTTQGQK
jgi:single-strand DNA-binding protein